MRTHRICPSCQRGSYVQDASHCPYCGTEYQAPVAAAPAVVTPVVVTPIDSRRWWSIIGIVLGFVVLVVILTGIIWGGIYFFTRYNPKDVGLNNIPKETTSGQTNPTDGKTEGTTSGTTAATTAGTTAATTAETTAATTAATAPTVTPTETVAATIGLDQPSKSWFLAKAGTLISGDVAIFDNDNNSKKTHVYDGKEGTADVIYLTQDTYIWTEWGCHEIENATAQDVANLINDKLTNGNFNEVRFFNGYTKLGTNTPTIISAKIDANAITLPAIATK